MQKQIVVLEKLVAEVPGVQSTFPAIQDEFEVLGSYNKLYIYTLECRYGKPVYKNLTA